jgi:hypothetical protein
VYTGFALIAFAANSVLCRLALGQAAIDAASFSTIRLTSGALVLLLLTGTTHSNAPDEQRGNWVSAFMLFLYAITFSFAYISLNTGTGALILFGSVQATMIIFAVSRGERLRLAGGLGMVVALAGLTYLVFPGLPRRSGPHGSRRYFVGDIFITGPRIGIPGCRYIGQFPAINSFCNSHQPGLFSKGADYGFRRFIRGPFRRTDISDRLCHLVCRLAGAFGNQRGTRSAARTRAGRPGGRSFHVRTTDDAPVAVIRHDYRGCCPGLDTGEKCRKGKIFKSPKTGLKEVRFPE